MQTAEIQSPFSKVTARQGLLYLSLALVILYAVFLNPRLDLARVNANDPAAYLARAVSLWEGRGYGEAFADVFKRVTIQPPAFSVMLAPIFGVFGMNFFILKLFMVLLAAQLAACAFPFFSRFLDSEEDAPYAVLLLMASPVIFRLSHAVMADIPLFIFETLALFSLDRYLKEDDRIFSSSFFVAAVSLITAYYFKQTALAVLLGGWFLCIHPSLRSAQSFVKMLAFSAAVAVPVYLWVNYTSHIPHDGFWTQPFTNDFVLKNSYDPNSPAATLADQWIRLRHNIVWGLSSNSAQALFPPLEWISIDLLRFVFSIPAVLLLGWQMVRSYLKRPSVLEGFVIVTIGVLLFKIEGFAVRYSAPVYPALIVYFIRSLEDFHFGEGAKKAVLSFLCAAGLIACAAAGFASAVNPYGAKIVSDYTDAAEFARRHYAAASTCIAPAESQWQVLSGHKCYTEDLENRIFEARPDYIAVLSPNSSEDGENLKDFAATVHRQARALQRNLSNANIGTSLVYQNASIAIYENEKRRSEA